MFIPGLGIHLLFALVVVRTHHDEMVARRIEDAAEVEPLDGHEVPDALPQHGSQLLQAGAIVSWLARMGDARLWAGGEGLIPGKGEDGGRGIELGQQRKKHVHQHQRRRCEV